MTKDLFMKQMKAVMNIAWTLVRVNGYTMSAAMKQSWHLFKLRMEMRNGPVNIQYMKKDGTLRTAVATTCADLIPQQLRCTGEMTHTNAQFRYFDVEKNSWRSFIVANLI